MRRKRLLITKTLVLDAHIHAHTWFAFSLDNLLDCWKVCIYFPSVRFKLTRGSKAASPTPHRFILYNDIQVNWLPRPQRIFSFHPKFQICLQEVRRWYRFVTWKFWNEGVSSFYRFSFLTSTLKNRTKGTTNPKNKKKSWVHQKSFPLQL